MTLPPPPLTAVLGPREPHASGHLYNEGEGVAWPPSLANIGPGDPTPGPGSVSEGAHPRNTLCTLPSGGSIKNAPTGREHT